MSPRKVDMDEIRKILKYIDEHGLYPDIKLISSPSGPEQIINGKKVISFCSNNYLGLAASEKLVNAAIETAKKYGVGSSGSRLLSGNLDIFEEMENEIAKFKKSEAAITFTAGYMANVGTISAVANLINISAFSFFARKTLIFSDELNHASIIDGCRLSRAKVIVYKHRNTDDLERKLRRYRNHRKLIVTDSIFSLDGDIAPLPKIVELAKKYKVLTMVDDAHATGVLGKTGSGSAEHFGLDKEIDIKMGTMSKALGASGGYVAANKDLIRYLRISSRAYIFATAMSPITAGAVIAAIREIKENTALRERLWENTRRLSDGFKRLGFYTFNSQSPIIPVLIGDEQKAIQVAKTLFERGFFAPCVRWPAVPKGQARIRVTVMAPHSAEQIDLLLKEFEKIKKELNIV